MNLLPRQTINNNLKLLLLFLLFPLWALAQPKADFSISPTKGCTPLVVQLSNSSTGNGLTYQWRFGNGNQSTLKDPGTIYYLPGNYSITLVVKDVNGQVDSITKSNAVTVYKSPEAKFTSNITGGCKPLTVSFSDKSIPGSGNITSWTWDFGDGNISTQQNPSNIYINSGSYNVKLVIKDANGCSHFLEQKQLIKVGEKPVVTFSASDSLACQPPLNVTFKSKVTAPPGTNLKYLWDFGDGNSSTSQNPSHNYTTTGSFNVKLTVTDSASCSGALTKTSFIVINKGKADFSFSPTTGCAPLLVNFLNNSTPVSSSFLWNFGNGDTSTAPNPSYTFLTAGSYKVKLQMTNAAGCIDSVEKTIVVKQPPKANFSASDSIFCSIPAVVIFTDKSQNAVKWEWNFGNKTISTLQNPVVSYKYADSFTVKLIVTAANGCVDSFIKPYYIKVDPPQAQFETIERTGCKPYTPQFNNKSTSTDSIISYNWNFDDGKTSTAKNPKNTFVNIGKYKVRLIIKTARGCVDTAITEVHVGDKLPPQFSATPKIKCIDTVSVKFTNLTPTTPVKADSFKWEFGDGGTSNDINPRHVYDTRPGKYSVRLISYSGGCADTLKKQDYIELLPAWANFYYKNATCKKDTVLFYDSSIGATSIRWKFDDGTTSTIKNPRKNFSPGIHIVILEAYNSTTGCKDTFFQKINVQDKFSASFGTKTPIGCAPFTVKFRDTISIPSSRLWDFGNGQTSTDTNPTVVYDKPGTYTVKLTVTSYDSCTIIKTRTIKVEGTNVKFSLTPDAGCVPLKIQLKDSSTATAGIAVREWDFGDGTKIISLSDSINHIYTKPPVYQFGGYGVTLTITDKSGCKNSLRKVVLATKPRARFIETASPDCNKLEYSFKALLSDTTGIGPFIIDWDFGDGTKTTTTNPTVTKTYTTNNTYFVVMKLTDVYGCKDSFLKPVHVNKQKPKIKFSASATKANCPPLLVEFTDSSKAAFPGVDIISWEWDFGDGTKATIKNPKKIYVIAGKFTVKLKVTDALGCTDSLSMPNLIDLKGPIGSYTFDKTQGCTPLTVKFTATSQNVKDFTWDLGDGTIAKGPAVTHTYTRDTNYIPLLIITDSTGCTVTLPPKDTIKVYPLPKSDFSFDGACFGYPTLFRDSSTTKKGILSEWFWDFGDGTTSILENPFHTYKMPGFYTIKHSIKSNLGCSKDTIRKIKVGGLKADFSISDTMGCVGTGIFFTDKTFSDSAIAGWRWDFGDGDSASIPNPVHIYKKKGIYDVKLRVWDYKGCMDTLLKARIASIGDTIPPPPPPIYRVTVVNDNVIQMDFAMYSEIDFERYIIYRETSPGIFTQIATIKNATDTIFRDSSVNTLHTSYCYKVQVRNFCGYQSYLDSSRTHCTIELTASPDINAAILKWNHYIGWDTIKTYEIYRQVLKNLSLYDFIGEVPGTVTTYTDTDIYCYPTHTYRVKAIEDGGYFQESWSDTAATTPIYVPNVPTNELIRATVENNKNVLVEWADVPGTKIRKFVLEKSENGTSYSLIDSFPATKFSYLDERVAVNRSSYYYRTKIVDSCFDAGPYGNIGKTILLKVDTNNLDRPRLRWSPYIDWQYGVRYYDIERKNPDGSFTFIDRTLTGNQLEYIDEKTDLNSLPYYCYRVIAHRNGPTLDPDRFLHITSTSNEDCAKVGSTIWVPNVFTPFNKDSLNDYFDIKATYVVKYHLSIFDRWGELVFESNDLRNKWNGMFKGEKCPMDVFIYQLEATGVDGFFYYKKGFVTILR